LPPSCQGSDATIAWYDRFFQSVGEGLARIGERLAHIFSGDTELPEITPPPGEPPFGDYERVGTPVKPPVGYEDLGVVYEYPGLHDAETTYTYILISEGVGDDSFAQDLLWTGWFDTNVSPDERWDAREMYFDYMDMDSQDFDWDAWREFYESA